MTPLLASCDIPEVKLIPQMLSETTAEVLKNFLPSDAVNTILATSQDGMIDLEVLKQVASRIPASECNYDPSSLMDGGCFEDRLKDVQNLLTTALKKSDDNSERRISTAVMESRLTPSQEARFRNELKNRRASSQVQLSLIEARTRQVSRNSKKLFDSIKASLLEQIKVAASLKMEPWEVTGKDLADYRKNLLLQKEKEAEACAKALIEEEEARVKTKAPKARGKTQKISAPQACKEPRKKTIKAPPEKTPPPLPTHVEIALLFSSQKPTLKLAARVTRWKTKDFNLIRIFTDRGISAYLHKTHEELERLRSQHHLPGIERLLEDPRLRETYCFKTRTGFGMIADLIDEKKVIEGVVTVALDKSIVYHRYFQPFSSITEIRTLFNPAVEPFQNEQEAMWAPVGTAAEADANLELTLSFEDESYRLRIKAINEP